MRQQSQAPLFAEPCLVCGFARAGEHEPWCPSFMRGAVVDGPAEQPGLFPGFVLVDGDEVFVGEDRDVGA